MPTFVSVMVQAPMKQARAGNAYISGASLGPGSVHAATDHAAALPHQGLQAPLRPAGAVHPQPGTVLYRHPDGIAPGFTN